MKLFDFFRRKKVSEEDIDEEYQKSLRKVRKIDSGVSSLRRDIKRYAEQTCLPQRGDDVLALKEEFIRIYAFRAQQWSYYHTQGYKKKEISSTPLWTQKWHDYEQDKRLKAQKRWREILKERERS